MEYMVKHRGLCDERAASAELESSSRRVPKTHSELELSRLHQLEGKEGIVLTRTPSRLAQGVVVSRGHTLPWWVLEKLVYLLVLFESYQHVMRLHVTGRKRVSPGTALLVSLGTLRTIQSVCLSGISATLIYAIARNEKQKIEMFKSAIRDGFEKFHETGVPDKAVKFLRCLGPKGLLLQSLASAFSTFDCGHMFTFWYMILFSLLGSKFVTERGFNRLVVDVVNRKHQLDLSFSWLVSSALSLKRFLLSSMELVRTSCLVGFLWYETWSINKKLNGLAELLSKEEWRLVEQQATDLKMAPSISPLLKLTTAAKQNVKGHPPIDVNMQKLVRHLWNLIQLAVGFKLLQKIETVSWSLRPLAQLIDRNYS